MVAGRIQVLIPGKFYLSGALDEEQNIGKRYDGKEKYNAVSLNHEALVISINENKIISK